MLALESELDSRQVELTDRLALWLIAGSCTAMDYPQRSRRRMGRGNRAECVAKDSITAAIRNYPRLTCFSATTSAGRD